MRVAAAPCCSSSCSSGPSGAERLRWLRPDAAALTGDDVDVMLRWLKEASRTPALGRALEKRSFLGVPRRRGGYERTEQMQTTLEQLRELQRTYRASRGKR